MLKKLVKIAVVLVILLLVAIGAAIYFIDSIAKGAVERAGTFVLGVPTTLNSMSIGLVRPSASMATLKVANPSGFDDPSFLALGTGALAVDVGTLMSDVVRIPSIRLSDLNLFLEQKGESSNASAILANMKSAIGGGSSGGTSTGSSGGKRFVIDELLIENINITARASGLPIVQPTANVKVNRIRLESLGNGGKDPIGMDQLTAIIINAVMQAAIEAGASQMPKQLIEGVLGGLAGLGTGLPSFDLSMDTGSGFKELGDLSSLASRVGVDLSSVTEKVGADVKSAIDNATKGAADSVKKGLGDLLK